VEGSYALDRATGIVTGSQRYREPRDDGGSAREAELPVRFRLADPEQLEALARDAGCTPVARWGDYAHGPFRPSESAHFLVELR
jgi:hypothetical protein